MAGRGPRDSFRAAAVSRLAAGFCLPATTSPTYAAVVVQTLGEERGCRYCEVVQFDEGLWIHST